VTDGGHQTQGVRYTRLLDASRWAHPRVRPHAAVIVVLVVGFSVRVICDRAAVALNNQGVSTDYLLNGPDGYRSIARNLIAGRGYVRGDAAQPYLASPPLYPLFLAGLYAAFGEGLVVAQLAQAALGAVACALTFILGRSLFGHRVGVTAGMLWSVYPLAIWCDADTFSESLFVPLVVVAALLFARAATGRMPLDWIWWGIALGLAVLCRASALTLGPVMAVGVLLAQRRQWPRAAIGVALAAGAALLVFAPWGVRNYIVTGGQTLMPASTGGWVLYAGPHVAYDRGLRSRGRYEREIEVRVRLSAQHPEILRLSEAEQSRWLAREAVKEARHSPAWFALTVCIRAAQFWYSGREGTRTLLSLVCQVPLLTVGAMGLWLAVRRRAAAERALMLGAVLTICHFWTLHSLTFATVRYCLPAMPFVVVFASLALTAIPGRMASRFHAWRKSGPGETGESPVRRPLHSVADEGAALQPDQTAIEAP
jgi:4-amino-4-deoxy-L-arabinose transferase-like glycosyltransferase